MDVKQISFSAKDAQYAEVRKLNLAEVAGFFHILPQAIGILDNANYSNMESAHKQLYQDTLGPDLTQIPQEIALGLTPEFPDSDGVYSEFNLAEKMKGSFAEQARSIQTLVGGPVLTRNEGRGLLNKPRIEGADELIVPMNVTEGGQASPTDSAPPGEPDAVGDPDRPDPQEATA
jgi:HK97 family phage portal protein